MKKTRTGRTSQRRGREPSNENIPISTAEGRAIRRAFTQKSFLCEVDYAQVEFRMMQAAHRGD